MAVQNYPPALEVSALYSTDMMIIYIYHPVCLSMMKVTCLAMNIKCFSVLLSECSSQEKIFKPQSLSTDMQE